MSGVLESEFESEFETEFESEFETESEFESEFEGEGFSLGGLGSIVSGLLGEGESLGESEGEFEFEMETEGEGFSFGGLFKKLAPILKKVVKTAAPLVGTAVLGPAGGALGSLAASALGEGEGEFEFEGEFESEFEFEGESEAEHEIVTRPASEHEALAEMMAEAASHVQGEGEAEAMAGAAAVTVLSPRDRRALSALLPDLLRGTAVLTRILRSNRQTRPLVRTVPTIMRRSVKSLKRQAASGRPVNRRTAARTTVREMRKVLGSPRVARAALVRNKRMSTAVKRAAPGRRPLRAVRG